MRDFAVAGYPRESIVFPKVFQVVEGDWGQVDSEGAAVALPATAARALNAKVGSSIGFEAGELTFHARVAAIVTMAPLDRFRCCFFFNSASARVSSGSLARRGASPCEQDGGSPPGAVSRVSYHVYNRHDGIDPASAAVAERRALQRSAHRDLCHDFRSGTSRVGSGSYAAVASSRDCSIEGAGRHASPVDSDLLNGVYGAGSQRGRERVSARVAAALAGGRILGSTYPSVSVLLVAPVGAIAIANLAGWLAISRFVGQEALGDSTA